MMRHEKYSKCTLVPRRQKIVRLLIIDAISVAPAVFLIAVSSNIIATFLSIIYLALFVPRAMYHALIACDNGKNYYFTFDQKLRILKYKELFRKEKIINFKDIVNVYAYYRNVGKFFYQSACIVIDFTDEAGAPRHLSVNSEFLLVISDWESTEKQAKRLQRLIRKSRGTLQKGPA